MSRSTGAGALRTESGRLLHMLQPLSPRPVEQQAQMIENVSAHYTALFLDQQIPATECSSQEDYVEYHDGSRANISVEAHEFVALVRELLRAQSLDSQDGQEGDISAGIQEQRHVGDGRVVVQATQCDLSEARGAGGL